MIPYLDVPDIADVLDVSIRTWLQSHVLRPHLHMAGTACLM